MTTPASVDFSRAPARDRSVDLFVIRSWEGNAISFGVDERVNEVFARKYGAADRFVDLPGDASQRVVVRLAPRH